MEQGDVMELTRLAKNRIGVGVILLAGALGGTALAASPTRQSPGGEASVSSRSTGRATLLLAAGAITSCSCGAFNCKGKDFPACTIQCAEPETTVCECGFCERTMGSPSSGSLGPVANRCECQ
jgi:hypothetical protein